MGSNLGKERGNRRSKTGARSGSVLSFRSGLFYARDSDHNEEVGSPFLSLSPSELSTSALYDLLVSTVQPRPIALVSSISATGQRNLAPFSFFMLGGNNPPSLMYSPTLNSAGVAKDSLRNVEETREFVVNLVDREIAEEMNRTSPAYPSDIDEWRYAHLTPIAGELVKPERVTESPVQFECKLFQIVRHGEGPHAANYVIGEILRIHLREGVYERGKIDPDALRLVARLGGAEYLDLKAREIFTMVRPKLEAQPSIDK